MNKDEIQKEIQEIEELLDEHFLSHDPQVEKVILEKTKNLLLEAKKINELEAKEKFHSERIFFSFSYILLNLVCIFNIGLILILFQIFILHTIIPIPITLFISSVINLPVIHFVFNKPVQECMNYYADSHDIDFLQSIYSTIVNVEIMLDNQFQNENELTEKVKCIFNELNLEENTFQDNLTLYEKKYQKILKKKK